LFFGLVFYSGVASFLSLYVTELPVFRVMPNIYHWQIRTRNKLICQRRHDSFMHYCGSEYRLLAESGFGSVSRHRKLKLYSSIPVIHVSKHHFLFVFCFPVLKLI
jgi:hypothetical protein